MPETTQSMTNPAPRCQRKIESRQCSDKCQISSAEGPGLILVLVLNFIHKLILKCFLSTHMAAVALTGVVIHPYVHGEPDVRSDAGAHYGQTKICPVN